MTNSIKKAMDFLNRGANALEVDVTFKSDDLYLYHSYPCDCFRYCWDKELLSKFLNYIRTVTIPNSPHYRSNLAILYFDLKISKIKPFEPEEIYAQGSRFADYLAEYMFIEKPFRNTIRLVVALEFTNEISFIHGFINRLRELRLYEETRNFIGYDIGVDKNFDKIKDIWKGMNITNVWQGDGITNCFNLISNHKLEELTKIRDGFDSYIKKVYGWTIDLTESVITALKFNIDGIMTNHPERITKIMQDDPEFSKLYRLATINDNPFVRHPLKAGNRNINTASGKSFTRLFRDLTDSFRYLLRDIMISIL